jgi:hypothetical protein
MSIAIDQIVAYGVAALTTGGGAALVIKQVRVALFKRAEAQSARIVAEAERDRLVAEARVKNAEAAKLRAEAEVEQARADRADAEGEVAHTAITAEMLARYEARLTQAEQRSERAEARAERAEKRVDECERRHVVIAERHAADLAVRDRRIAALERSVRRLGDTPTGIQAVDGREK